LVDKRAPVDGGLVVVVVDVDVVLAAVSTLVVVLATATAAVAVVVASGATGDTYVLSLNALESVTIAPRSVNTALYSDGRLFATYPPTSELNVTEAA
jgi:hypothetical protein